MSPASGPTLRYPRSRLEKLGVKPGLRVTLIGVRDDEFRSELVAAGAVVSDRLRKSTDLVFIQTTGGSGLGRLKAARASLQPAGAIWVLWPKGRREFTEDHVRAAAFANNLVDVKVVSFSDVLSGLKVVIPVADRPKAR